MIILEPDYYYKVTEPLKKVSINHFFARAVVERKVDGTIFVDATDNPKTFHIVHPYGMSLLFGEYNNMDFNAMVLEYALNKQQNRSNYEWMQVFPDEWDGVLQDLFKKHLVISKNNKPDDPDKIELNTRVNFTFNLQKYLNLKQKALSPIYEVVRTDKGIFNAMNGSVVPKHFWKNADQFYQQGAGYSVYCNNQLASTAYAAFVFDGFLELGIETVDEYRGKGLAQYACVALLDYCLQHNYFPVWSCRLENTASYNLAQKLGFDPISERSFYRLCK